jgi:hypothetical protein
MTNGGGDKAHGTKFPQKPVPAAGNETPQKENAEKK